MIKTVTCAIAGLVLSSGAFAATARAVLAHHADLAQAEYGDSLTTAKTLQRKIDNLLAGPIGKNPAAARAAWAAARHP